MSDYTRSAEVAPVEVPDSDPALEVTNGSESYIDTLRRIHETFEPEMYVEIGVRLGRSLSLAQCPAVGIDPEMDVQHDLEPGTELFHMTSDEFFQSQPLPIPPGRGLCFIDGMHLFEYVLQDFINLEKSVPPASLIVIDDVSPNHPRQASRTRQTRVWTGDVWKIGPALRRERPDLELLMLDTFPSGLLVVAGLDAGAAAAMDYERICAEWVPQHQPPENVLTRRSSQSPNGPELSDICRRARALGTSPDLHVSD